VGRNRFSFAGLFLDHGQTGSYSGPEVGLEEIAIDLLQARFWNNFQFADNPGVDIATSGLSQVDYGA
jgi:hypothetical protein